jgi:hypothetical protein
MTVNRDWEHQLSDQQLSELDTALRAAQKSGLRLEQITRSTFPLGDFADELAGVAAELEDGRGFVLLRGLPLEDYSEEEAAIVFWGIGQYIGIPVPQNGGGDLLGHVRDERLQLKGQGYAHYSNEAQTYHTDSSDVVALMCLRAAREGGVSTIASSMAIHNEILASRPELLEPLYQPFAHHNRGEVDECSPPYHYSVIASYYAEKLSIRFGKTHIVDAYRDYPELGPLDRRALEAWELIEDLADKFHLDMDFRVGDIQLLNNYTVVHARTAYQDHEEMERRRHLLRLWLTLYNGRLLASNFGRNAGVLDAHGGRGGIRCRRDSRAESGSSPC